ncbi:DUF2946 family protein [Stieleria neptunia]|nr:DUF2946 family protein [Stieleria neptunia]
MSSSFRPILASLLCCMIVLGHAPAWLHVAHCEGHGHAPSGVATEKTAVVSVCSHGCQHHASPSEAADPVSDPHDSGEQHPHDSDTCVICQSLASPSGVTWELLVSLPSEFISHPVVVAADSFLPATLLSIPQPRGPPAVA